MNGTFNQSVRFSGKIGGTRKVFEGQVKLLPGGFNFDISDLPAYGNALPAGTPVYCDDETRAIKPIYTFKPAEASTGTTVKVAKGFEGTRAKVGMYLAVAGDDLATAATTAGKVTAVDSTSNDYDVVTVGTALTVKTTDILIEVDGTSKLPLGTPNALLPYDVALDEDSVAADGDGAWNCMEYPVLENRMPPVNDAIKKALADAGCFFRFSKRK